MSKETIMTVLPLLNKMWEYYMKKRKEAAVHAWKTPISKRYEIVKNYYDDIRESMFSFEMKEGGTKVMPFLVLPDWSQIDNVNTDRFKEIREHILLSSQQMEFWHFYGDEIQKPGWKDRDDDVFRPISFEVKERSLELSLQLCKFSEAFVCQYLLEHELLLTQISCPDITQLYRRPFAIRDKVARNLDSILSFFEKHPARMGINNLFLLRKDNERYKPMVYQRGELSMVQQPLFDAASSCVFSVQTNANKDRELLHTVTREIAEELFGYKEAESRSNYDNPNRHYYLDGISDLMDLMNVKEAEFHVTGFGIDLIRLIPEITTLLVVRDSEYHKVHYDPTSGRAQFHLNKELLPASDFEIPAGLKDADGFLKEEIIRNPNEGKLKKGFDPELWTLPASFSFVQGIRRATSIGI